MLTVIREMADGGAGRARQSRAGAPAGGRRGGRQDRGREHDRAAAGPAEGRRRRRRRLRPARALPRPRRGHRGPHARRQGDRRRPRRGARGRRRVHRGGPARPASTPSPSRSRASSPSSATARASSSPARASTARRSRRSCCPIGDSALVVGDERTVKVHVHVNDPGVVLSEALRHGSIGDVEINDMHAQTRERDERLSAAPEVGEGGTVVVAVVAGAGNQQLFRDLGCHAIVDGGQSMNPSAAQLLKAVEELGVDEVVILPNNGNVILTAEQAAGMSSLHIAVVPSRSIPSGLAAMVAFDPAEDAVGNARAHAGRHRRTCATPRSRTRCATPSWTGSRSSKGQAMGIVDGRLVAAADDILDAFGGVLEEFARGGAEYVTVLTALNGSGTTREQLEELAARVAPDAEVSFHEGGQPLVPDPRERRMSTGPHRGAVTAAHTREHGHRPRLHLRRAGAAGCEQPGPLHGAAQGPLRRPDVPRRRRHDLRRSSSPSSSSPTSCRPPRSPRPASSSPSTRRRGRQYEHVFSLHISGEMSGTVRAAEQAAEQVDHVYVYDMRTVTTALSLCAERLRARLAAGLHARRGARLRRATSATTRSCSSTPRPSSTCVAAAASAVPPRWSAACSTSSRSSPPSTAR